MKAATLIILLLSNQGYWLSNQTGTISVQWNATSGVLAADLQWDLMIYEVTLASGKVAMPTDDKPATISIKIPQVRVRTTARFAYRLIRRDNSKQLDKGEVPINLFPPDLTSGWADRLHDKQLVVIDSPDGLPKLLDAAKVQYARVDDASRIDRADVILVGPDQIDDSTFAQSAIMTLAEQGRSVMIFRQSKPSQIAGYPQVTRPMPTKLTWRLDHPLFERFSEADLQSWLASGPTIQAIELPADESALELAWWPRESPGIKPVPIEAAALVKAVGTGRIVLFNIPLGDWQHDPRSQLLLNNALTYLLTPVQPTLKPSEREISKDKKNESDKLKPQGDHQ